MTKPAQQAPIGYRDLSPGRGTNSAGSWMSSAWMDTPSCE